MLKKAEEQGITDIVNTTHYKHPKMFNKEVDYNIIKENINNVEEIISKNSINIKLHAGAETFFHEDLLKLVDDKLATFGNGKYMLIEFLTNFLPFFSINSFNHSGEPGVDFNESKVIFLASCFSSEV